ncbi:prolyl oligopeptidase family serine peptidase [Flavivirga aquimarina]|uniref:Prolyl oligopeptidase family serine peptidase n=1 Tax=Flavivirga aquimarina TaxID=2027862 RepID=A0ABT8WFZ6_9FLAO|nr:prolyl oligopeptidase family serine peptidase [Flavivirga aquimarina]MDO5971921.1 prolyl oligopeptidase family serine peptidase [Flavivirga aquimarina]
MKKYSLGIFLAISFLSIHLNAQETITFKKGLVVGSTHQGNRSIIFTDSIYYKLITKTFKTPVINDTVGINGRGDVEKWEPLEADDKGVFKSRKLRRGYLYLTYDAPESGIKILEISGHSEVFVNGTPRSGDVYNKHLTFHPVNLKKGRNIFLIKGGRGQVNMQLLPVKKPVALMKRDMTIPDFLTTEDDVKTGSIRILNATPKTLKNLKLVSESNGVKTETNVSSIIPLTMRKVPYKVRDAYTKKDTVRVNVKLYAGSKLLDEASVLYRVKTPEQWYSRTFTSKIDGSVQYFAVKEGAIKTDKKPAMFLSLHGASVEARRQAAEYKSKDWGHVIAPTNRRPFGFNWEDWGRWDAMEVQGIAEKMYGTDPSRTYLKGHSMGGHGTWHVGVTYPNKWAAISPIAGWYSLFSYANKEKKENPEPLENMFARASHQSYTLELSRNYLHHGVYIQHGDADDVVSVDQARFMKKHLSEFHPDFAYLEYEDKKHWFGIDFNTIFDYFKWHTIPDNGDVKTFEFRTASPGVSNESRFVTLYQQEKSFEFCGVKVKQNVRTEKQKKNNEALKKRSITIETENLKKFKINLKHCMASETIQVKIDDDSFDDVSSYKGKDVWFEKENDSWILSKKPSNTFEKNPLRYGTFKDAFKNNMVFVYGTKGTKEENKWSFNKARFDAETFYYKGNGSIDVISDKDFSLKKFKDRSVIIYGNASTNAVWKLLLSDSPIQVKRNEIRVGEKKLTGDTYGAYFIYPRKDSQIASVGAITGSGMVGFNATTPNRYFSSGAGVPDVMIFTSSIYKSGVENVNVAGYFGTDWSIENGDIEWKN